jgi:thioredoxin 1
MTDEEQQNQPEVELLDFWAPWCGPCKIMDPILYEIEEDYKDKLAIRKLNVDEEANQPLMATYNVLSVPTYILLRGDEVLASFIGAQHKATITDKIDSALKAEVR